MKPAQLARQMFIDAYSGVQTEDEWDPDGVVDLGEFPPAALVDLLQASKTIRRAADRVIGAVEGELAERLDGKELRVGDTLYRHSATVRERVNDPQRLIGWLGTDWHHVVPVSASTRLRKGGLDYVAEKRPLIDEETGEVLDPKEVFIEKEFDDPKLKTIPLDKAPKYARELPEGEVVERKRVTKGD